MRSFRVNPIINHSECKICGSRFALQVDPGIKGWKGFLEKFPYIKKDKGNLKQEIIKLVQLNRQP